MSFSLWLTVRSRQEHAASQRRRPAISRTCGARADLARAFVGNAIVHAQRVRDVPARRRATIAGATRATRSAPSRSCRGTAVARPIAMIMHASHLLAVAAIAVALTGC